MADKNHIWNFSKVGGVKRVNLESGNDLLNLEYLDQKLWTALSCPVHGLEIDPKTLELIDTDHDDRIRVPEIVAAVKWISSVINNADDLLKQEETVPLSSINSSIPEGLALLSSAKQILKNIGKPDAQFITLEDASDTVKIFADTKFNGDGIITEDSTEDSELKKLINDIVTVESTTDRNGKPGISLEIIEIFYKNCEEFSHWRSLLEANIAEIEPFGEKAEDALNNYLALKSKIEDYFIRCRLAEFDAESTDVLNTLVAQYENIRTKDLSTCIDEIAAYPIAKIEANKALPLTKGINPAWEAEIATFKSLISDVIYKNKASIGEKEWESVKGIFDKYIEWKNAKAGDSVEPLGLDRIREILTGTHKESLIQLIEQDKTLENEANNIILVEKLVRYYRDIYTLLKNFVTFYDFYTPGGLSVFQAGTLYIDQRSCNLCIRVNDMPKHNTMAGLSGMYLLYCDCTNKQNNEKISIVVAMTDGDTDNLMVGRNAVFYDRKGLDWDATVTKIIENPISIRQAFWSPYRKVSRFIEAQIHKMASAKEGKVVGDATTNIEKASTAKIEPAAKTPPPPFDIGKFVGIFAAIGLALGAIGGVLAAFVSGFLNLVWWKMPIALAGIILLISGPSMIIAFLKLRKRNLTPLLDANGWAMNAKSIVNTTFGKTLTHLAKLPKDAKINLNDPFTKKKRPFLKTIIALVIVGGALAIVLWRYGILQKWLFGH